MENLKYSVGSFLLQFSGIIAINNCGKRPPVNTITLKNNLLRWNAHNIKLTILKITVASMQFTMWNHHIYFQNISFSPKKNLLHSKQLFPQPLASSPDNHQFCSVSIELHILDILYKCNVI